MAQDYIKGKDFILYLPINGVNYAFCHARNVKIAMTADVVETTTKNGKKGKTRNYTGKYDYSVSLDGITALDDLPQLSVINASNDESNITYNDSNLNYTGTGVANIELPFTGSDTRTQLAGGVGQFTAYSESAGTGTNPLLNLVVVKNGITVFSKSVAISPSALIQYNIKPSNSDVYSAKAYSTPDSAALPNVNIVDSYTSNDGVINISRFQDAVIQSNKIPFIFTDTNNVTYQGTVLVTGIDFDSPYDGISTFTNNLLGDGELIKSTTGVPIPVSSSVLIENQFGDLIATVAAPGIYNVLQFNQVGGGSSLPRIPSITIAPYHA